MHVAATSSRYPLLSPGDLNGFFGLMFDNLTVLSFLSAILIFAFNFPADIVYTRMFPGTALGVLFGDLVYTLMAFRLARRTNNPNVTAMPLGLDTPSTIGIALVVLGPAFTSLKASGLSEHQAGMMTWYIGMATMLYMGLIKFLCAFLGKWIQSAVPTAGLLGSLAGIAMGLIGVAPLIDIFGMPLVGVVSMGLLFATLLGGLAMPAKIPGVLASVALGTAIYYGLGPTGMIGAGFSPPPAPHLAFTLPWPSLGFIQGLKPALAYLPLSIPFALLTVVGGINTTESARVAGDDFSTRDILLTEALATLLAGLCGGVAQTTPYIGQPAYKNMGARAGYTLLTGLVVGIGGMLGQISFIIELIPRAALAPILVFVAIDIVTQAFHAVPARHAPAVALSFFPTIFRLLAIKLSDPAAVLPATFDTLMATAGGGGRALPDLQVIVALGNGFIITAMLWAGFLVHLIDRRLRRAAAFLAILAILSLFGITHSALADGSMYWPWRLAALARRIPLQFTLGYATLAALFLAFSFTRQSPAPGAITAADERDA